MAEINDNNDNNDIYNTLKNYNVVKKCLEYVNVCPTLGDVVFPLKTEIENKNQKLWDEDEDGYCHQCERKNSQDVKFWEIYDMIKRIDGKPIIIQGELEYICEENSSESKTIPMLVIKNEKSQTFEKMLLIKPNVSKLIENAKNSGFGDLKTNTTKFDENVRKSLEITDWKLINDSYLNNDQYWNYSYNNSKIKNLKDYEKFEWLQSGPDGTTFGDKIPKMLKEIILTIRQSFSEPSAYIQPQKLIIYQKDDFFDYHVDTPTNGAETIGTLILNIPNPHKGGDLELQFNNQTFTFSTENAKNNQISWCAFYSDVPHIVKPVISGERITLTFQIYRDSKKTIESVGLNICSAPLKSFCTKGNDIESKIVSKITMEEFVKKLKEFDGKSNIGFITSHKYAIRNFKMNSSESLKGFDKNLFDCIEKEIPKNRIKVFPVIVKRKYENWEHVEMSNHISYDVILFRDQEFEFLKKYIKITNENEIENEIEKMSKNEWIPIFSDIDPKISTNLPTIANFIYLNDGDIVEKARKEGVEFTGNEASPTEIDHIYFSVAIIILSNV